MVLTTKFDIYFIELQYLFNRRTKYQVFWEFAPSDALGAECIQTNIATRKWYRESERT